MKRKNPEVIKWFNKSFRELPNINETRVFLKEICKSILKSGGINQLESQFILNCVRNYHFTFTVAVNKDHKKIDSKVIDGEIIFEDRSYKIFKNSNINLEKFAEILLAATDDPLAEQYKTHKPLFLNKGLGLKIAASDIMNVNSITNQQTKLSTNELLLSYVKDTANKFEILLEKRSIFGNHQIYKINKGNFQKVATIYPAEIDKTTIKQIFNELEYEQSFKSVVQSKIIKTEEENQIFEHSGKLRGNFLQNIQKLLQDIKPVNLKLPYIDLNTKLDLHEVILNDHERDLKDSRTKQTAETNRETKILKKNNPPLYNYCNTFYWAINKLITACCIAETEYFKNNVKKTFQNKITSFLTKPFLKLLNLEIKKLFPIAEIADLTTDTLEEVLYGWLEAKQNIKHKNNVIIMDDIIRHKVGMLDLNDILKKIAITIMHARKNEVTNPENVKEIQSLLQKAGSKISDIINKVKKTMSPKIIESHDKDNIAVQLALKDSIAFINYLYTNYHNIMNEDADLLKQCKNIVENGTLDVLFQANRNKE